MLTFKMQNHFKAISQKGKFDQILSSWEHIMKQVKSIADYSNKSLVD